MNVNIHIAKISNGFILSDGYNGEYVDHCGVDRAETRHYPTLDEMAADAARFVRAAVVNAETRMREYEERMRADEERYRQLDTAQSVSALR